MKLARLAVATATIGAALMAAASASAASYVTDITANPATFTCNTAHDLETCGGITLLVTPVTVSAGDTYSINTTYVTALKVPGSRVENWTYNALFDGVNGGAAPYTATPVSTLFGYVGPPGPFTTY